jgi:predicted aspartyl protease
MIFGFVHNREAIIQLAVVGDQQKKQGVRAVIDTGFTGSLTLPLTMIANLELAWFTQQEGFLGDGSRRTFDVYRGIVIWDGQLRVIGNVMPQFLQINHRSPTQKKPVQPNA